MKKKTPASKRGTERADFQGYVTWDLNELDKAAIRSTAWELAQVWDELHRLVESDYKFSISWDTMHNCYSAALFDQRADRPTGGWILTGKHADMLTAVNVLLYLHEVKFKDGWPCNGRPAGEAYSW